MAVRLSRNLIIAITMASILILAAVLVFGLPWSQIRVIVSNVNPERDRIRVTVSIDGSLKATADVSPWEAVTVGVWTVWAGSHLIEVNYDYPDYPPLDNLGDPPEWAQKVGVGLFSMKEVFVGLGY